MDVSFLYPNIDHQDRINACETAPNTRTSQSVPTSVLCDLIMTILKCNTLKFRERFFHQIKGTAIGTPMAVNLANLFMRKFETDLLNDYRNKYNKSPGIWLKYIDDIFFTWDHDESSLKHFISFCNSYSTNQNMKSKISFEADCSMSPVYFLDTKVKFNAHTLATELYSKLSAFFQYLHRTSFHPPHTFSSILKSQFIRIRRICTNINNY